MTTPSDNPTPVALASRGTGAVASPREPFRLGALATHPIQYHAPLYRALAAMPGLKLTVYFAHRPSSKEQGIGFGVPFSWDEDLTAGYRHVWLRNEADRRRASSGKPFRDRYGDYDTPAIGSTMEPERFDAFLLHGWRARSDWQALRACEVAGVPVMVRGDSQLRDDPLPKRWVKRLLYPQLLRRFAVCLSVGERSAEYFRYYGARHVVASPHFIDNQAFRRREAAARSRRDAMRRRWGVSRSALAVLFAGKLVPRKRPLDVLQALRGVIGVHALMVGDGGMRERCDREARRLGVPATFTGFLNQSAMADAYAAADVLVLPSDRRETWGLVVNEAMASRRPAIVSDAAGCAPDLIREGITGYTYPAGDVSALRGRLMELVDHPAAAERMGQAAAAHIGAYSVEAAAAGVLEAACFASGTTPWV